MRAINYPFTLSTSGKISATADTDKIYLDRLLTLVSTIISQRPMRPSYGVNYDKSLYENANVLEVATEAAIKEAVAKWLPNLEIEGYNTTLPDESGIATINLSVRMPNNSLETLSMKTYTMSTDGTLF